MQMSISVYDTHKSQRERILTLFRLKGFCYTQELINLGIYQYNARLKELRNEGFLIKSQKINGKFAFKFLGVSTGNKFNRGEC